MGLVARTVYAGVSPRGEYRLTEQNATLPPLSDDLQAWAERNC